VKVVYAETSAVLGWLLGEESLRQPAAVIDSAERVVTSVLTLLEASRGILRAANQNRLAAADASRLRGLLARAASGWDLLEITPDIRTRAAEAFPVEPVRTLDAVHLATMLDFVTVFPEISVLSFDARILANLEPLGLPRASPEA
jgi:predicted nucleic acid-binding protein